MRQQRGENIMLDGLKKILSKTCTFPHVPQAPNVCLELQENQNQGSSRKPGNIWVYILPLCQGELNGGDLFLIMKISQITYASLQFLLLNFRFILP